MLRAKWIRVCIFTGGFLLVQSAGRATDADALAITSNILARHLPYGAIMDPIFASTTTTQITGYTRCGDSALWTGAFLAAEAFRYKVTHAADAMINVSNTVSALQGLVDVTGTNLLARCMVPANSPYAAGISSEENANGVYTNSSSGWIWIGNTSRDEYTGVIFGLGVAYDMIDDATVKSNIAALVTRLVRFLSGNNWSVVLPGGGSSTTFLVRPEEMLALVQVGRHVNSAEFEDYYDLLRITLSTTLTAPVTVDIVDDNSYFKFNLDYMTFYNLIRLESSSAGTLYSAAYDIVRHHTASHQNAFFDIVDRGLSSPDATRDTETVSLLNQWLQRPRRDVTVDLSKTVSVCGSQACSPIPVPLRVPTDFLWQRSPFQLSGGGSGIIESAGIDYILPYWMARYYGVIQSLTVQSAASGLTAVAPESLASLYGSNLAAQTAQATSVPLPTSLGGVMLNVTDTTGTTRNAPLLYVSATQINFEVPAGTAPGTATFNVTSGSATQSTTGTLQNVAPSLFSANGTGMGVAAATAVQTVIGSTVQGSVPVFQCSNSGCTSVPINLGVDTPIFLTLYGTGIRNRSALSNVRVTVGGVSENALYAGAQGTFAGLDQINIPLSLDLRGKGEVPVVVVVDGQTSNAVTINVQ